MEKSFTKSFFNFESDVSIQIIKSKGAINSLDFSKPMENFFLACSGACKYSVFIHIPLDQNIKIDEAKIVINLISYKDKDFSDLRVVKKILDSEIKIIKKDNVTALEASDKFKFGQVDTFMKDTPFYFLNAVLSFKCQDSNSFKELFNFVTANNILTQARERVQGTTVTGKRVDRKLHPNENFIKPKRKRKC